jgi:hypothetical protein
MSIRLALALLVMLLVGAGAGYNYLFGKATVHIVMLPEEALTVNLDGQPSASSPSSDGHIELEVRRGKHTFELIAEGAEPTKYELAVKSGFDNWVLPVTTRQCFVRFDISDSHYGTTGKAPIVTHRFRGDNPFEVSTSTHLQFSALPQERKSSAKVYLLVDLPCPDLAKNDQELAKDIFTD